MSQLRMAPDELTALSQLRMASDELSAVRAVP